jgi:hypothetical protein
MLQLSFWVFVKDMNCICVVCVSDVRCSNKAEKSGAINASKGRRISSMTQGKSFELFLPLSNTEQERFVLEQNIGISVSR